MPDLKFDYAVLCDDVRRENTGKDILIGVYGGNVKVPAFPAVFAPVFWISMTAKNVGSYQVDFWIKYPGESDGHKFEGGNVSINEVGSLGVYLPPIAVNFIAESPIALLGRIDNGEWETIVEKKIELVPAAGS